MWLSNVIISLSFLAVLILLIAEKTNRVILAISGAVVCYLALIFIENERDFTLIIEFLFGTVDDGYVNIYKITR